MCLRANCSNHGTTEEESFQVENPRQSRGNDENIALRLMRSPFRAGDEEKEGKEFNLPIRYQYSIDSNIVPLSRVMPLEKRRSKLRSGALGSRLLASPNCTTLIEERGGTIQRYRSS